MALVAYTDGSCRGNRFGAFAYVLVKDDNIIAKHVEKVDNTTNNAMEIRAIIAVLRYFNDATPVEIYTDSNYAKNCLTSWARMWRASNWMTRSGSPVQNRAIIEEGSDLVRFHKAKLKWVKAHVKNPKPDSIHLEHYKYNDIVDNMAQDATREMVQKHRLGLSPLGG